MLFTTSKKRPSGSTPGSFLQVAKTAAHLFSFMRPYLLSFSFFTARHCLTPFPQGKHPRNSNLRGVRL
jgi:hypothetical protein